MPLQADMWAHNVVEDAVRFGTHVQPVRQQLLEVATLAALWVTQGGAFGVETRRFGYGRVHQRLPEVHKGNSLLISYLADSFRICRANLGVPRGLGVAIGQVQHRQPDLIERGWRHEKNLWPMRHNVGMGDDARQIGLEFVQRDVLEVGGQRHTRIVGPKQDELERLVARVSPAMPTAAEAARAVADGPKYRQTRVGGGTRTRYSSFGPPGAGGGKMPGSTLSALDVLYPERPRLTTSRRRRHSGVGPGQYVNKSQTRQQMGAREPHTALQRCLEREAVNNINNALE